jgi:hypothetical protein
MLHRIALPVLSEWCQLVVVTIAGSFSLDTRGATSCPHLVGFTLGCSRCLRQLYVKGVVLTFPFLTYARVTVTWASASKRTPLDKRDYYRLRLTATIEAQ